MHGVLSSGKQTLSPYLRARTESLTYRVDPPDAALDSGRCRSQQGQVIGSEARRIAMLLAVTLNGIIADSLYCGCTLSCRILVEKAETTTAMKRPDKDHGFSLW